MWIKAISNFKKRGGLAIGTALLVVSVFAAAAVPALKASAAGCGAAPSGGGSDALSLSVPSAGAYNVWVRMLSPDGVANTINVDVNGTTCYTAGGSQVATGSSFSGVGWIKTTNTGAAMQPTLNAGNQTITLSGSGGVEVDRVMLISSSDSCTPSGTGSNCIQQTPVSVPFHMATGLTSAYTDGNGVVWSADNYYTDGSCDSTAGSCYNTTTSTITNAPSGQQKIYQNGHWGPASYNVPIANGTYNVQLDFSELNASSGTRSFTVSVEGGAAVTINPVNLTATQQAFNNVTVTGGSLDVVFTGISNAPLISGIEVTNPAPSCTASPSTPTGLAASGTSTTGTTLNWNAVTPASGCTISGYNVYQNGSTTAVNGSTPITGTSKAITGLTPSTTYTYTVSAVYAASTANVESAKSSSVSVTTNSIPMVSVPFHMATGLTSAYTDGNGVSWAADQYFTDGGCTTSGTQCYNTTTSTIANAPSGEQKIFQNGHWGVGAYHIPVANGTYNIQLDFAELNSGSGARSFSVTVEGGSPVTVTPVTDVGDLTAEMKTFSNVAVTGNSLDIVFTGISNAPLVSGIEVTNPAVCSGNPSTPTGLTAGSSTTSTTAFSWNASTAASNCTLAGYNIYRNGSSTPLNGTPQAATNYTDSGLTQNTTYTYTVQAVDTAGHKSAQSSSLSDATNASCATDTITTPGTPTEAANPGYTTLTLNWSASSVSSGCTLAGYNIYRNGSSTPLNGTLITGTSYPDTGLTASGGSGTGSYTYTVEAVDSKGGKSSKSASGTATTKADDQAPNQVTGVTAAANGAAQINVSWGASSDLPNPGGVGIAGYQILRSLSSSSGFSQINTVGASTLSYSDTTVSASTKYYYEVVAYDAVVPIGNANASAPSAVVNATTAAPTCSGNPTTPTSLVSTGSNLSTISLSWSASSPSAGCTLAGYHVYRNGTLLGTSPTGTTFTDSGLNQNTTYSYTVQAYDTSSHTSSQSTAVNASTTRDNTAPTAPASLTASATSAAVSLSWPAGTDNVSVASYNIYRNGTLLTSVASTGTGTQTYQDTTVTQGTSYTYQVATVDENGTESTTKASSGSVTVPTATDTTKPSSPSGLSALVVTGQAASLGWTAATDNVGISLYQVYLNGILDGTATNTNFADQCLAPGVTYTFTVYAKDTSGNVSQSPATLSVTTPATSPNMAGDINCSSSVDSQDLATMVATTNWGMTGVLPRRGDVNGDGAVGSADLAKLVSNWGHHL